MKLKFVRTEATTGVIFIYLCLREIDKQLCWELSREKLLLKERMWLLLREIYTNEKLSKINIKKVQKIRWKKDTYT